MFSILMNRKCVNLLFAEHFVGVRHYAKFFAWIIVPNPYTNTVS